jgi:hypothetical protein
MQVKPPFLSFIWTSESSLAYGSRVTCHNSPAENHSEQWDDKKQCILIEESSHSVKLKLPRINGTRVHLKNCILVIIFQSVAQDDDLKKDHQSPDALRN